jgi:hypothetical protein
MAGSLLDDMVKRQPARREKDKIESSEQREPRSHLLERFRDEPGGRRAGRADE